VANPVVRIAPNNPVFDLPVLVAIEEGLFAEAGLEVSFSASYADRERDSARDDELVSDQVAVIVRAQQKGNYTQEAEADDSHPEDERGGILPLDRFYGIISKRCQWSRYVLVSGA